VVVVSRLSPATSSSIAGVVPTGMVPVRHNSTYHTSTGRLLGMVNSSTSMIHSGVHSSMMRSTLSSQSISGGASSGGGLEPSSASSASVSCLVNSAQTSRRKTPVAHDERSVTSSPCSNAGTSVPFSSNTVPFSMSRQPSLQQILTAEVEEERVEDDNTSSRPATPASKTAPPLIPENGDWINDHLDTIHAILEYRFQSPASGDTSSHVNQSYESFDRLLKNVHKRKCLCVPMINTTQTQQRTTIGTYIISALNDNSSIGSHATKNSQPGTNLKNGHRSSSTRHDEAPHPQLFLVGAAMNRYAPVQPHSSQFVDDSGRSMGACVRDICEILTADDIFVGIGGQM
jgi:hypothetical protein